MPCYDDGPSYDSFTKEKLDKVTRLLCGVMNALDDKTLAEVITQVKGLKGWWSDHKQLDRQRMIREETKRRQDELKRTGLEKLTPEERQALGLR